MNRGLRSARLITFDPGHFHAALVQKEMLPGIDRRCHVYAPLGPDLLAHLGRLAGFNSRAMNPTAWEVEVHAGPDPLARLLADRPGNVVVFSGRNRGKMKAIQSALDAGLHVLADKPWVIDPAELPVLDSALATAEAKGLVALDIMTERYEITSILQRELVADPEVFGTIEPGSLDDPAVAMQSVHYLIKQVAGVPLRRPAWFFDVEQQGEGLSDVGTHLVDLVPWILFPEQVLDPKEDIQLLQAERHPTLLSRADFQQMTGEREFPPFLAEYVQGAAFSYFCNTKVSYTVRGVHVTLDVLWDRVAAEGGDTHRALFRGSRSVVEVRQGAQEGYRPELYVIPRRRQEATSVQAALRHCLERLQARYPGLSLESGPEGMRVVIPDDFRVGHEAHFAQVTDAFLRYLDGSAVLPAWEKSAMLGKYRITTEGVRLAREITPS